MMKDKVSSVWSRIAKRWISGKDLPNRLRSFLKASSHNLAYAALLLYHSYRQPDTPGWAKRVVVGSLAYMLAPIDSIPDLTPFIGFTDDLGVLMFGLVSIAGHVTEDVRSKARGEMTRWFGITDFSTLRSVDQKI